METRWEIRLAGLGGQGLLLAGLILAEAASIHEGKHAVQTQSYAPFARGGASSSEIIISDQEIDYPRVERADILIALSQEAYEVYHPAMADEGLLLADSRYIESLGTGKAVGYAAHLVPFTEIARKAIGREMAASMVALGAISGLTEVVELESLMKAVVERAPKGTADLNKVAVRAGFYYAIRLKENEGSEGDIEI